jgi:HAD superfamily hydrolase (TIGR01509 family)
LVIFDCNGVLVDSEPIAAAVLSDAFKGIGVAISADTVARRFQGRRPSDIFATVEAATNTRIPPNFPGEVAAETLRRLRTELRAIAHAAHALTWIRGPKAVASSSSPERIHLSLEVTNLIRFFETRLFSASSVYKGKPAPDVFLLAAARSQADPSQCIVVEDSRQASPRPWRRA